MSLNIQSKVGTNVFSQLGQACQCDNVQVSTLDLTPQIHGLLSSIFVVGYVKQWKQYSFIC